MPRKPKVQLPSDLSFQDSEGMPSVTRRTQTPEESSNPFIPPMRESWDQDKPKKIVLPADAEDTARAQIRNAAALLDMGSKTRVEYGTNSNGDNVVMIHFRATVKRKRSANGTRKNKPAESDDTPAESDGETMSAEDKLAANSRYGKNSADSESDGTSEDGSDAAPVKGKRKK